MTIKLTCDVCGVTGDYREQSKMRTEHEQFAAMAGMSYADYTEQLFMTDSPMWGLIPASMGGPYDMCPVHRKAFYTLNAVNEAANKRAVTGMQEAQETYMAFVTDSYQPTAVEIIKGMMQAGGDSKVLTIVPAPDPGDVH